MDTILDSVSQNDGPNPNPTLLPEKLPLFESAPPQK